MDAPRKEPPEATGGPRANPAYWIVAAALVVFGFLWGFSIGIPLLALGLALVALAPVRDRPATFWPPLASVFFLFLGYILVAPLGCTSSAASQGAAGGDAESIAGHMVRSATVCTNILGLQYSGAAGYRPSLLPAVGAGVAAAATAWALFRWLIGRTVAAPRAGAAATTAATGLRPKPAWWIVAGGLLGLAVLGWFEGILSFLVALAVITRLGARRTPGWPLLLVGTGAGTVWWTLQLWLHPACRRGTAFGRPAHAVVERCLERASPVVWPVVISLGLIVLGMVLFLGQRRRAASASPRG